MSSEIKNRKWYRAAGVGDIPLREGRRVSYQNYEVALFNLGEQYRAIDNRCPHKQGPLADGILSGKSVFCPMHNLKISLENGCALNGGEGQVRTYPVRVIAQDIYIAFEEAALQECDRDGQDSVASPEV